MHKILAKIWGKFGTKLKWYTLWVFHDKFMIGTSAIILDEAGRVLLLQHRFWLKNSWGLPSGYAKRNEKLELAIAREIKEETNLDVEIQNLINLNSGFKLRIECTFSGSCKIKDNLKVNSNEILEARFFDINDLPSGLLETHKNLIKNHFKI